MNGAESVPPQVENVLNRPGEIGLKVVSVRPWYDKFKYSAVRGRR